MVRFTWDTETTGLPPKNYTSLSECPNIVQIAGILTDDDKELASMNVIIKPDGWVIPEEAAAVHGISTELAEKVGVPIKSALSLFSNLCRSADQLVAHNSAFDEKLYGFEIERIGQYNILKDKDRFCTMLATVDFCKIPSQYKWSKYKWPRLEELYDILFGEEIDGAHDALVDVRACHRCHMEIIKRGIIK